MKPGSWVGLGFKVGLRVWDSGSRIHSVGFRVQWGLGSIGFAQASLTGQAFHPIVLEI